MRTVTFAALLVLVASSLAAASISLSARDDGFATDLEGFVRARGHQSVSDLAVSGDTTYVAWYDYGPESPRGMITRIGSDGMILDPIGRPAGSFATRLVPDGDGVGLYWVRLVDGERALFTTRVSSQGDRATEQEVLRAPRDPYNGAFDVAEGADGRRLVAIGPYLSLLDGNTIVRQRTVEGWGEPTRVVAVGNRWVVAWVASGGFAMWAAFDQELNPIGAPGGSAISNETSLIDLAADGDGFLYAVSGILGLDVWRVDLSTATSTRIVELDNAFTNPHLTKLDEGRYLLSWTASAGIEGAEIVNGTIGPAAVLVEQGGFNFHLVVSKGELLVADERGGCFRGLCEIDVFATISGTTSSRLISAAAPRQSHPVLANDAATTFAVWLESAPSGETSVAWGRLRSDGRFETRRHVPGKIISPPTIGAFGGHAITLWPTVSLETFAPVLEGYVLDQTGAPSKSVSIRIDGETQSLAIAGGPGGWLVAWYEWTNGEGRLAARRIGFDGVPLGDPIVVGPGEAIQQGIGIDRSGDDFVLVWVSRTGTSGSFLLRSARVSATNQVVQGNDLAESTGFILHPSVSCRNQTCLAAWNDDADGDSGYDIIGRTFDVSGLTATSPPFVIAASGLVELSSLVSATETAWVVGWTERHPDSSGQIVRAARIDEPPLAPPPSVAVGPATYVDSANHSLACLTDECLSIRVLSVDDPVRGRTDQLMRSSVFESSRRRGVRRTE